MNVLPMNCQVGKLTRHCAELVKNRSSLFYKFVCCTITLRDILSTRRLTYRCENDELDCLLAYKLSTFIEPVVYFYNLGVYLPPCSEDSCANLIGRLKIGLSTVMDLPHSGNSASWRYFMEFFAENYRSYHKYFKREVVMGIVCLVTLFNVALCGFEALYGEFLSSICSTIEGSLSLWNRQGRMNDQQATGTQANRLLSCMKTILINFRLAIAVIVISKLALFSLAGYFPLQLGDRKGHEVCSANVAAFMEMQNTYRCLSAPLKH
ncbi:hypothetical protein EGR_06511 [Echinococcus granulosus]|uniref:Uncharacterized protein n=1 Tax=Echinococcus granulosus TaxID=6210 RepID=W6UB67_ECHGR|nr:hypothetical protein EGR_06511 [Echinococcus granulosus]EUB58628.1 hypothetical protein EGR_06511 [Echinococcus granulosus]